MSKIYQALEKAERERDKEKGIRVELPPVQESPPEPEKQESWFEAGPADTVISVPNLVSSSQPGSLASEQFRKLRSHLLKLKHLDGPRTIMVTSATNGEGKTFVAANLAAGIAHDLHTQAIVIDCDLRNPSLSEWFDLPKTRGLSDYLTGNGGSSEYILKTGLEKLSVFPAGSILGNPTELIASKKMETLIHELKSYQNNRYIIFDATPILATTEPEVLARLVDGILFVVRAGMTPRETIQQAMQSLDKEKILGVVLNDVNFKSSALHSRYFGSDGYYYKYGYGYGYGRRHGNNNGKWWGKLLRKKHG